MNDLSEYEDVKQSETIDLCLVEAFGLEWKLKVTIEPDESNNENYIGICLFVEQCPIIK